MPVQFVGFIDSHTGNGGFRVLNYRVNYYFFIFTASLGLTLYNTFYSSLIETFEGTPGACPCSARSPVLTVRCSRVCACLLHTSQAASI